MITLNIALCGELHFLWLPLIIRDGPSSLHSIKFSPSYFHFLHPWVENSISLSTPHGYFPLSALRLPSQVHNT